MANRVFVSNLPLTLSINNYIIIMEEINMIKREIETKFKALSNSRKVVLVTGARQVGKSTFVKSLKEDDRTYITLDDLSLRDLAQNDPKLFLMNYKGKLIIDEVQYAPNLFSYIKMDLSTIMVFMSTLAIGSTR